MTTNEHLVDATIAALKETLRDLPDSVVMCAILCVLAECASRIVPNTRANRQKLATIQRKIKAIYLTKALPQ